MAHLLGVGSGIAASMLPETIRRVLPSSSEVQPSIHIQGLRRDAEAASNEE